MPSSQVGQRAAQGTAQSPARRPRPRLEAAVSSQFYRKSRSGSSAFQNETRASTGLAVTSKELSQLLVGKDPVTADMEKYPSIVVAVMLEKPVRLCQSSPPTTPIALPQGGY